MHEEFEILTSIDGDVRARIWFSVSELKEIMGIDTLDDDEEKRLYDRINFALLEAEEALQQNSLMIEIGCVGPTGYKLGKEFDKIINDFESPLELHGRFTELLGTLCQCGASIYTDLDSVHHVLTSDPPKFYAQLRRTLLG